jgi:DNA-binding transcriptional LysR family regulator
VFGVVACVLLGIMPRPMTDSASDPVPGPELDSTSGAQPEPTLERDLARFAKTGAARRGSRPPNVSLKQLRGFVVVAEEGSFTRAAQQLFLSQSALSALVRGLEDELGLRLFDRTTRRLELTEAGQEFKGVVQRALADLEGAANDLRDAAQRRRGRVRLGTTPLLASTLVPPLMQGFSARYPDIELSLLDASTDVLLASLRRGELDLALSTFERSEADMQATALLSDPMVAVCPRGHPLAGVAVLTWRDLLDQPLLLLREGSGLRALVDRCFETLGVQPRPAQQVTHVATAMAMAASGMGVAILPAYALRVSHFGNLVGVALTEPALSREISLVHLRERSLTAAAQAMSEHLREHLLAHRDDGTPRQP